MWWLWRWNKPILRWISGIQRVLVKVLLRKGFLRPCRLHKTLLDLKWILFCRDSVEILHGRWLSWTRWRRWERWHLSWSEDIIFWLAQYWSEGSELRRRRINAERERLCIESLACGSRRHKLRCSFVIILSNLATRPVSFRCKYWLEVLTEDRLLLALRRRNVESGGVEYIVSTRIQLTILTLSEHA